MAFPPSFIDELIARNPIEDVVGQYVSLKSSGSNMFGLCPFHGEKGILHGLPLCPAKHFRQFGRYAHTLREPPKPLPVFLF